VRIFCWERIGRDVGEGQIFRNVCDETVKGGTYEVHANGRDVAFGVRVIGKTE
jgi:hypothetical protein